MANRTRQITSAATTDGHDAKVIYIHYVWKLEEEKKIGMKQWQRPCRHARFGSIASVSCLRACARSELFFLAFCPFRIDLNVHHRFARNGGDDVSPVRRQGLRQTPDRQAIYRPICPETSRSYGSRSALPRRRK